ncbi:LCP family protein [Streptomyces scopuliridis]|uniref:LCP family protein n=1 Tax=Streptomyces scopuliridis TaxID=452529 RepID=UPI0036A00F45
MTDSAGTATEPDSKSGSEPLTGAPGPDGSDAEPAAPPSDPNPKRHWLRWVALGTSVAILATAGAGWWFYRKLDGNITTDTSAAAELHAYEKERPTPVALDAQNILLVGSDSRSGEGNSKYGRDDGGSQRSDTTILLHLAADRKSATAMSIPRDLMVEIPSCAKPDGTRSQAQFAQFNWAFEAGGAACTIRTVEKLTGIRVDHHMVIDFSGFTDVVDAVDGVEVCLAEPVNDVQARLELPAGRQTLDGEQALGFVRARHGIGDGSDTQRMDRQQRFLGALFKKVQSNGVLLNPARLYPVLDAATKSLTTDSGLNSLSDLYELARSMRSVPMEKVQFLTVPRQPYTQDPNRDELVEPAAKALFERLRDDAPVSVSPGGEDIRDGKSEGESDDSVKTSENDSAGDSGAQATGSPSPAPTFQGTNAAAGMCG